MGGGLFVSVCICVRSIHRDQGRNQVRVKVKVSRMLIGSLYSATFKKSKKVEIEVKCKHDCPGKGEMLFAWENLARHQRRSKRVWEDRGVQRAETSQ